MYANILLSLIFCDIICPNVKDRLSIIAYSDSQIWLPYSESFHHPTHAQTKFRSCAAWVFCLVELGSFAWLSCLCCVCNVLISITPRLGELRQLNLCYTKTARFINFSLRYLPITNLPIVLTMAHNYHQVKKDIRSAVEQVI